MPGRSSRRSTPATSSPVNTWVATKRPSARPSRSFWVGMIAVCGIGMPSGWRNSAVTANQSAMPPMKPALAAACSRSAHQPSGNAKLPSVSAPISTSRRGGEGAVAGQRAAGSGIGIGIGIGHAEAYGPAGC